MDARIRNVPFLAKLYSKRHPSSSPPCPGAHNLPVQLTTFVGRERELAEIRGLVETTRLLTLAGTGGVGKTRLALQVAADLAPQVEDGVWLVELGSLSSPLLVEREVASTVGVLEQRGRGILDTLVDSLRTRELVLLLDNCEHLAPACAEIAGRLLASCPRLRILATSRVALRVPGEVAWRVPSLSLTPPPPRRSATQQQRTLQSDPRMSTERSEAAQLFLTRAASASPNFVLSARNGVTIEDICRRLDGIPLAIELAAARVRVLTPEQIAARLDRRLELLTRGEPTAVPRQRTLRASLDWSYELLGEQQRTLLRRLSVFAGGCTIEAVEATGADLGGAGGSRKPAGRAVPAERASSPGDTVLDLLSDLVESSLVLVDTATATARYAMLETVRAYAAERLQEAGEELAMRGRHRDWCVELAERAAEQLEGRAQVEWLDRLELEHENLRAALRWCVERQEAETGLRLARALFRFWLVRDHLVEGYVWLETLLGLGQQADTAERADVLLAAGRLAELLGFREAAERYQASSLQVATELGRRPAVAAALTQLGRLARGRGDYILARRHYEESIRIRREVGPPRGLGIALTGLGRAALGQGDVAEAVALLEETRALHERFGHQVEAGTAILCLGDAAAVSGNEDEARARYAEALAIGRDVGDRTLICQTIEGIAETVAGMAPERTLVLASAAAKLRAAIGVPPAYEERNGLTSALAAIRHAFGAERSEALWSRGHALETRQAVEEALAAASSARGDHSDLEARAGLQDDRLTRRERDVALLIARGLTNRQVADELVISELTAATHVRNILGKLGFEHRTQVAVWAVQQGLRTARPD